MDVSQHFLGMHTVLGALMLNNDLMVCSVTTLMRLEEANSCA